MCAGRFGLQPRKTGRRVSSGGVVCTTRKKTASEAAAAVGVCHKKNHSSSSYAAAVVLNEPNVCVLECKIFEFLTRGRVFSLWAVGELLFMHIVVTSSVHAQAVGGGEG